MGDRDDLCGDGGDDDDDIDVVVIALAKDTPKNAFVRVKFLPSKRNLPQPCRVTDGVPLRRGIALKQHRQRDEESTHKTGCTNHRVGARCGSGSRRRAAGLCRSGFPSGCGRELGAGNGPVRGGGGSGVGEGRGGRVERGAGSGDGRDLGDADGGGHGAGAGDDEGERVLEDGRVGVELELQTKGWEGGDVAGNRPEEEALGAWDAS